MNARVGIFGGTFNPIHVGHLRAAEEAVEALGLERLVFVPCAEPPHKRAGEGDPIAAAELRLEWLRLALADNPHFDVDPIELERGGPSYSVDTLRVLGARSAPELPVFVIGQDAFLEVHTWREPETLLRLAHFAVLTRPPAAKGSLGDWLPEGLRDAFALAPDGLSARHRRAPSWLRVVEITALDVSASDIRRRLREGRSVRYLLPEPVHRLVIASGAYGRAA